MKCDVLVVVTAHNYARFLPRCLESVIAQQGGVDWRLVIVDDGSSDETPSVVERYLKQEQRFSALRLEGVGLSRAANAGIRSVDSKYIFRLDADDWIHPNSLSRFQETIERLHVDLVYSDFYLTDEAGTIIARENRGDNLSGPGHERSPHAACCLYRRAVFDALGGYNESLRYQEDFDFWLRFIETHRCSHIDEPLFSQRLHGVSMSTNKKPRAQARRRVKAQTAERLGKPWKPGSVPVYLSTLSTLPMRISPGMALFELGGRTLLDRLVETVSCCPACGDIHVVTATEDVAEWAASRNFEVIRADSHYVTGTDLFADIGRYANTPPFLVASPYYPLIDPERVGEVLNTLAIFDCGRVYTCTAEVREIFTMEENGLHSTHTDGGWDVVRPLYCQAGGLSAFGTGGGSMGMVEILSPEGYVMANTNDKAMMEFLLSAL